MIKKKIYIVEDMAFTRAALIDLVNESDFDVVGSAAHAEIAWEEINALEVDLILLDINLAGEKNGIWLALKIRETMQLPIVFLTAYGDDQTLEELKSLNPNGYLMKPFNKPSLITTLNIALNTFNTLVKQGKIQKIEKIILEVGGKKIKIAVDDISFVSSDGNYLEINLDKTKYIIRSTMSKFLESLPKDNKIVRCHLRFAINIDKIQELSVNDVTINTMKIPVSKTYKSKIITS